MNYFDINLSKTTVESMDYLRVSVANGFGLIFPVLKSDPDTAIVTIIDKLIEELQEHKKKYQK